MTIPRGDRKGDHPVNALVRVTVRIIRSTRLVSDHGWMRMSAWLQSLLLLLMAVFTFGCGDSQSENNKKRSLNPSQSWPLEFESEVVKLYVEEDSVRVEGIYRMICHPSLAGAVPLYYPFPEDSLLGGTRMVKLLMRIPGSPWQPLNYQGVPASGGVRFLVPLKINDAIDIYAIYRQEIRGNYARYIVESTQAWQQPLKSARFEIYLPDGAEPVSFSYPFKKKKSDEEGIFYLYETKDFMPGEDIKVTWE